MVSDLTDEQLVRLAVDRDPDAFGEIVTRWHRKIFALCLGILKREDEAKDAAQETFIAAYRNLERFRGEAKVSSWLHRIAVNQCLSRKRKDKRLSENLIDDSDPEEIKIFVAPIRECPSHVSEKKERLEAVRTAVNALPPDLKEIVLMKEFREMTFQEISEEMDVPLSTVKSRMYTALKQLRMKLESTPIEVV
ncbi:MAG: RNA polymerase sigma factor [Acidobacteria bacterium]|nr:MAG: RNA polymerase sigma factor [Acidobacteriota bacterium]REK01319.1 MAG: RNA polymerase sigma factor [Acidobacteriota bacterium]REK14275.1 MAG: RNA polymerase sigma factor [Acidobacteriota bacterium]REK44990.1 MAG: RNA polymerase sigma factor [Acidobacteriota bacterium]